MFNYRPSQASDQTTERVVAYLDRRSGSSLDLDGVVGCRLRLFVLLTFLFRCIPVFVSILVLRGHRSILKRRLFLLAYGRFLNPPPTATAFFEPIGEVTGGVVI